MQHENTKQSIRVYPKQTSGAPIANTTVCSPTQQEKKEKNAALPAVLFLGAEKLLVGIVFRCVA